MSAGEVAVIAAGVLAVIAAVIGVRRRRAGTFRLTVLVEREHHDEDAAGPRDTP